MSTTPVTPQQSQDEILRCLTSWTPPVGFKDIPENGATMVKAIKQYKGGVFSHANLTAVCGIKAVQDAIQWHTGHSPSQRSDVWNAWWAKQPAELLRTPENGQKIIAALAKFYGSEVTFPNLDRAFEDVKSTLEFQAPPTAKELAEARIKKAQDLEAADLVRRLKEAAENDEKASLDRHNAAVKKDKEQTEWEKQNEIYRQNVINLISTVQVYSGANRINYSKTEELQKEMGKVRVYTDATRKVVDWKATLKVVRDIWSNIDSDGSSLLNRRGI